jgi:Cu(I)/Ag(I) efflux system membrane fusion protein
MIPGGSQGICVSMRLRNSLLVLAVLVPFVPYSGHCRPRPAAGGGGGPHGRTLVSDGPALEPVRGGGAPALAGRVEASPVPVRIERQLSAVRLETVGRVAVDETRMHRLRAATRGWMRVVGPAATGTIVDEGEVLAVYGAPGIATLVQDLIHSVENDQKLRDRLFDRHGEVRQRGELASSERSIATTERTLRELGMPAEQIEHVRTTLQFEWLVEIRSPVRGLVLARNVSSGQRFEPSTELYAVADLSRVWIWASASEGDASYFKLGARATVTDPDFGTTAVALVSSVLPRSDPARRTVKVRLEADNPGFLLRPDMTVNVDLPVELGPAITGPGEAVIGPSSPAGW